MKAWKKRLTKKEMQHLRDTQDGRPTITALRRNIEGQARDRIICFECKHIAQKLGINMEDI